MPNEITPRKIRLEVSSYCQLRCPSCPTTTKHIDPAVGSGFLKLSSFKALIDSNPWLEEIELSNYGEIFLNPELLDILRYAHDRHVALTAANGANMNMVRDDVLDGLVRYQLRLLTCSVDGASDETYRRYRVRGNFSKVIKNIKRINTLKESYKSEYPNLTWQFVVFGHNEHEIPLARQMAKDLGMEFRPKLNWDRKFSPVRNKKFVRDQIGKDFASREEYKEKYNTDYSNSICDQLWNQPQINWDGRVLGCCRNFWGDFKGNAFTEGLVTSLNNEPMRYAREMLQGTKPARQDIPCTTCDIYLDRRARGRWLVR